MLKGNRHQILLVIDHDALYSFFRIVLVSNEVGFAAGLPLLHCNATISDISPKVLSLRGGTITITGSGFGTGSPEALQPTVLVRNHTHINMYNLTACS